MLYIHIAIALRENFMSAVLYMIKEIKNSNANDCHSQHTAMRNMTGTPWVTSRQTWDPTESVSMSQTMNDSTSKGPPWAKGPLWTSLPSTSVSPADTQHPSITRSLLHPSGLLITPSKLAQPSRASGEGQQSPPWQLCLKMV